MKILLAADLHNRREWYDWLRGQNADLTVIAGDLLDGFLDCGLLPQMLALRRWCAGFPGALAVCGGNHDANTPQRGFRPDSLVSLPEKDREDVLPLLLSDRWMDSLEELGVVPDGRTNLLQTPAGQVVVTTIPYDFQSGEPHGHLWEDGSRMRIQHKVPWIVLHHEPPAGTLVGGNQGDRNLHYKIREYQPDFVVSGNLHSQPYVGSFADKVGGTWCFNPGHPEHKEQLALSAIPNHITLDLAAGTATWHGGGSPVEIRLGKG